MRPGHWVSDAQPPLGPSDPAWERVRQKIADLDAQFCEGCRAKVLDPLCPVCLEMALREVEAVSETQVG